MVAVLEIVWPNEKEFAANPEELRSRACCSRASSAALIRVRAAWSLGMIERRIYEFQVLIGS